MLPPPGFEPSVRAEAETCCPRCGPQADRRAERGSPKATAAQSGRRVLVPSTRPAPDWNCLQADGGRRLSCNLPASLKKWAHRWQLDEATPQLAINLNLP